MHTRSLGLRVGGGGPETEGLTPSRTVMDVDVHKQSASTEVKMKKVKSRSEADAARPARSANARAFLRRSVFWGALRRPAPHEQGPLELSRAEESASAKTSNDAVPIKKKSHPGEILLSL